MIETIALILLALWVGGLLLHVAGGFIHILLVLAVVVFAMRFLRGATA